VGLDKKSMPSLQKSARRFLGFTILILSTLGFSSFSQAVDVPVEAYDLAFSKGIHALNEKRYEEASEAFREVLEAKGTSVSEVEGRYYLALSYRLSGRNREALKWLQSVLRLDPSLEALHFDLGMVYFQLSEYQNAIDELLKAERIGGQPRAIQASIQYHLGLSLMESKAFEKATTRFLRVAELIPEQGASIQYLLAVSFYRQGRFDEAKKAFKDVLGTSSNAMLLESSRRFLGAIAHNPQMKKPWVLAASLGLHYDDNVILLPEGSPLPVGISDQSDLRWVGRLRAGLKVFQSARTVGFARYNFYQSLHQDLDAFDAQSHNLSFTTKHALASQPYRFDFSYRFSHVSIDGESYLQLHTLRASLDFLSASARTTRIAYRYQDKDFLRLSAFPGSEARSGMNNALSLLQEWNLDEAGATVHGEYTYDEDNTVGKDWDYRGHSVKLGLSLPKSLFPAEIQPALGAAWGLQYYKNANSFSLGNSGRKREDRVQTYTINLSKSFAPRISGDFQYLYSRNNSNIRLFNYERQIVSLTMTYSY